MAPALAPKALERVGVSPVGLLPSVSPLIVLSLVSTYYSPCTMACRFPAVWGSLSRTSPAGGSQEYPCLSVPFHGLSPWGYLGHWLGSCPALVRVTISLAICCPNSVVPSPKSVVTTALTLPLSWISSFSVSALWAATINWE